MITKYAMKLEQMKALEIETRMQREAWQLLNPNIPSYLIRLTLYSVSMANAVTVGLFVSRISSL